MPWWFVPAVIGFALGYWIGAAQLASTVERVAEEWERRRWEERDFELMDEDET